MPDRIPTPPRNDLMEGAEALPPALVEVFREVQARPGCSIITDEDDGRIFLRRGEGMSAADARALLERLRPFAKQVFAHVRRLGELHLARLVAAGLARPA